MKVDKFLIALLSAVQLASLLPARGAVVHPLSLVTDLALAFLFFLHGAQLSRRTVLDGIGAWRIHVAVLVSTFLIFPVLGLAAQALAGIWLQPTIGAGVLLLCLMPSTVATLDRDRALLAGVDRGVILLVVYSAFSAAVIEGLWHRYSVGDFAWTAAIDAGILAVALVATTLGSRLLGFPAADEIAIVFCGSKKSLASGVPIVGALSPPPRACRTDDPAADAVPPNAANSLRGARPALRSSADRRDDTGVARARLAWRVVAHGRGRSAMIPRRLTFDNDGGKSLFGWVSATLPSGYDEPHSGSDGRVVNEWAGPVSGIVKGNSYEQCRVRLG